MAEGKLPYEKEFADLIKTVQSLTEKMSLLNAETDKYITKSKASQKEKPTTLKEYSTATEKLTTNTKELINIDIQKEKLQQQKIKTEKDLLTLATKKANEEKKEAKRVADLNNLYKQESDRLNKLRADAKSVAIQFGTNSKQFRQIANDVKNLDKKLKDVDKSLGQNQRNVGNYAGSFVKGFTQIAGALGIVTGASALLRKGIDTIKDSIQSTQTIGDKFNNKLEGYKEGYNSFIRAIATGGTSFTNLIQNFRDAVKVGTEYSAILDDLGDRQRALRIVTADTRLEQEKLLTISRDVSKSNDERLKAIDDYIKLEKELVDKGVENAKKAFGAEILIASERSELSEFEIMQYLKNYEKYTEIADKRILQDEERQKKLNSINTNTIDGINEYNKELAKIIGESLIPLSEEEKQIQDIIESQSQLADEIRDRVVVAYENLINVETSSLKSSQRLFTMRASLIKQNMGEEQKAIEDRINLEEEQNKELVKLEEKLYETYRQIRERDNSARLSELQYEIEKTKEAALEKERQILFAQGVAIDTAGMTSDALFEIGNNRRQAEYDDEIDKIDKLNISEEAKEKKREALNKKLQKDQKEAAKKQALINGALAVTNILATTPKFDFGIATAALIAAAIAETIAQVAVIDSQKFAEGVVDIKGGEKGKDSIKSLLMPGETVHTVNDTQRALNFHHALHDGASDAELFTALSKDVGMPIMLGLNKEVSKGNNFDDRLYKEMMKNNYYMAQLVSKKDTNEQVWIDRLGRRHIQKGNKEIIIN